jgi:hypothetical protein
MLDEHDLVELRRVSPLQGPRVDAGAMAQVDPKAWTQSDRPAKA